MLNIPVEDLSVNLIVASNVVFSGKVIVSKGALVTQDVINTLEVLGVKSINVYSFSELSRNKDLLIPNICLLNVT